MEDQQETASRGEAADAGAGIADSGWGTPGPLLAWSRCLGLGLAVGLGGAQALLLAAQLLGWTFEVAAPVAVAHACRDVGVDSALIKWPNDVWAGSPPKKCAPRSRLPPAFWSLCRAARPQPEEAHRGQRRPAERREERSPGHERSVRVCRAAGSAAPVALKELLFGAELERTTVVTLASASRKFGKLATVLTRTTA